jgi:hypothetical protein
MKTKRNKRGGYNKANRHNAKRAKRHRNKQVHKTQKINRLSNLRKAEAKRQLEEAEAKANRPSLDDALARHAEQEKREELGINELEARAEHERSKQVLTELGVSAGDIAKIEEREASNG